MVLFCCVQGCYTREVSADIVTPFYPFPKSPAIVKSWMEVVPLKKPLTNFSKICNKHFRDTDFFNHDSRNTLKPTAVPSIFPNDQSSTNQINVGSALQTAADRSYIDENTKVADSNDKNGGQETWFTKRKNHANIKNEKISTAAATSSNVLEESSSQTPVKRIKFEDVADSSSGNLTDRVLKLLEKREEETLELLRLKRQMCPEPSTRHPIQLFFDSVAQTLMTFPPDLAAEAKVALCELVCEFEQRADEENKRKT